MTVGLAALMGLAAILSGLEAKAIAAIARLVGLSRKSVYKALEPARDVA